MGECELCDVDFDFDTEKVYTIAAGEAPQSASC
jgi:hypothetical protein